MGFSSKFLFRKLNNLFERYQFVQIDDRSSELARVQFGVPQGSVLGPVILNFYVADLQNQLQKPCYQFADDTNTKATEITGCATDSEDIPLGPTLH